MEKTPKKSPSTVTAEMANDDDCDGHDVDVDDDRDGHNNDDEKRNDRNRTKNNQKLSKRVEKQPKTVESGLLKRKAVSKGNSAHLLRVLTTTKTSKFDHL